jgi:FkbM family methyltransferase
MNASLPDESSRAEGGIDLLVQQRFFPGDGRGRVLVEVGAARPDYLSTSAFFRSSGWTVLAIEPNPDFARLHRERGLPVLEYACGDREEDEVPFTVVDSHGVPYRGGRVSFESFSSLGIKPSYRALRPELDTRTIHVRLRRLDTILREHAPDVDRIDVLSVDVEGWELEVLEGLDFGRHRPRVMIVENYFGLASYRSWVRRRGYLLWKRSFPNDVYVDEALLEGRLRRLALRGYAALVRARALLSRSRAP